MIYLELMAKENLTDIFEFEGRNKTFFEKNLPPRPEGYFTWESFRRVMDSIISEQKRKECFMHLIREDEVMVGRINFSSVIHDNGQLTADLGYRIGKDFQGRKIATRAVQQAVKLGFEEYGFSRITAGTSTENMASQKVLENNGFVRTGREERVFQVNGTWVDGYLYERTFRS